MGFAAVILTFILDNDFKPEGHDEILDTFRKNVELNLSEVKESKKHHESCKECAEDATSGKETVH